MADLTFEEFTGGGATPVASAPAAVKLPPYVEEGIKRDKLNTHDANARRAAYLTPEELAADEANDRSSTNLKELDTQIDSVSRSKDPKKDMKLKILNQERERLRGGRSDTDSANTDPTGMGGGEEDNTPAIIATPDGTTLKYNATTGKFDSGKPMEINRTLSVDEFMKGTQVDSKGQPIEQMKPSGEKDKFGPLDYGIAYTKGLGAELGAIADVVLGIPGMALSLGANLSVTAQALGSGESWKTATGAGRQASEAVSSHPMNILSNPVYKALSLIGSEKMYEGSTTTELMGQVSKAIVRAGDWLEAHTGGAVTTESFQTFADALMVAAGSKGGDTGVKAWKERADRSAAEKAKEVQETRQQEPLPVEQGPQITAQEQINQMLNIKSIPEREKYDAQRKKEVRAAFKADPDYANYLDSLATQRMEQHDAWTKESAEADLRQKKAEDLERLKNEMPPNVDVPLAGAQIHYPPFTFDQILEIMQKPSEARTKDDLLLLKSWNRQAGATTTEGLLWTAGIVGTGTAIGYGAAQIYKNYLAGEEKKKGPFNAPEPAEGNQIAFTSDKTPGYENLLPGLLAAGAVKGKGGMWHPEAVERLAQPLIQKIIGNDLVRATSEEVTAKVPIVNNIKRMVSNYLNKYAGTEGDPLKDVEIPFGREGTKRWEEVSDGAFKGTTGRQLRNYNVMQNEDFSTHAVYDAMDKKVSPNFHTHGEAQDWAREHQPNLRQEFEKVGRDEKVWGTGLGHKTSVEALTSYLSHVGDYLRQNVDPAKLQQYDLVRAVKETAKNDERVAKEMEKAATSSMKDMSVYKEYPDGMKWVELKLPEKLTEEQKKNVREIDMKFLKENVEPEVLKNHQADLREELGREPTAKELNQSLAEENSPFSHGRDYIAVDAKGKPVMNSYTSDIASDVTPERAHLAGQLAQEGNQMGHCVGGYCEGVASGESRIFSLRDKKGRSHVTIEVESALFRMENMNGGDLARVVGREAAWNITQAWENLGKKKTLWETVKENFPDVAKRAQEDFSKDNITQIKGKQNRAPNAEYLPYVQDFVKGGKWGEVGDLENTQLIEHNPPKGGMTPYVYEPLEPSPKDLDLPVGYYTREELYNAYTKAEAKLDSRYEQANSELGGRLGYGRRGPRNQEGRADLKLIARLAAAGIGVTAGIALDPNNKIEGAILGGLGALAVSSISPKGVASAIKSIWTPDTRIRINDLANSYETKIGRAARQVWQLQTKIESLVPDMEGRTKITHAIESGDLSKLTPKEQNAARMATAYFEQMKTVALDAKVLKSAMDNYVTHLWEFGSQTRDTLMTMFGRRGQASMSPESRFALQRSVPTIAEGKTKGLVPQTEDISAIMGIYGNSINRSLANKEMLAALRNQTDKDTGARLVMPANKAPQGYVQVNHPQMTGVLVHPDIAPSLRFIYDNSNPGVILRGLEGLNTTVKRMAVSFSLFHAKALADAFIGAAHNPFQVVKMIGQAAAPKIFGENAFLKQLREGGAGDLPDKALESGLKFGYSRAAIPVEDVGGTFYRAMKDLQGGLDSMMPGLGLPVKAFTKLNHIVDGFMWDRLHAGMKLMIYAEKRTALLENNAKAHLADPVKNPMRSEKEIGEMAASFTNDIFGGLNWRRVAEDARTKWGRDAALAAFSPTGRRITQLLVFAPDWTLSTVRAMTKAAGEGSGIGGVFNAKTTADLHRQYLLRSALYYVAVGDSINYSLSGHHLWENKDWTTIDMGDGRRMQWSKHTMEPIHWATKPGQQALNKLAFIPREAANQLMGSEYLSTSGHAPRMDTSVGGRMRHLAHGLSPISVQQSFDAGAGSGIAGFLGAPIYGITDKQKMENKELRKYKRAMEGLQNKAKSH